MSQRLDKWLVYARFVRHRADAQAVVEQGGVRVNRARILKGSHAVKGGDVLTIAVHGRVQVVRVTGKAARRGSAGEARLLYEVMASEAHDGAAQKQDASQPLVC